MIGTCQRSKNREVDSLFTKKHESAKPPAARYYKDVKARDGKLQGHVEVDTTCQDI